MAGMRANERASRRRPALMLVVAIAAATASVAAQQAPAPMVDLKPAPGEQTAILAGGCFWGMEAIFERLEGVKDVVSGFSGRGSPGPLGPMPHAEVVKIVFDPARISYGTLLKVFFGVAHDPTQLNRQGPDEGPLYRSSIFFMDDDQKGVAEAYIRQLEAARLFSRPIVTTVVRFDSFHVAGPEHQDFVRRNPTSPYVVQVDLPKIAHLEKDYAPLLKHR
jgi:peptide-methionine (S)-S-oxide reductase